MFWLAWQLLGVLIVVVVIVTGGSLAWDVLRYIVSPSERESMKGFPSALFRLALAIGGAILAYWLFHGRK